MKDEIVMNWLPVTKEAPLITNKKYLIVNPTGDILKDGKQIVELLIVPFYKKGTIIKIPYKNMNQDSSNNFSFLTQILKKKEFTYIIPEDGFYKEYPNDEENQDELFSDCLFSLILCKNAAFFSTDLQVPDGYIVEDEIETNKKDYSDLVNTNEINELLEDKYMKELFFTFIPKREFYSLKKEDICFKNGGIFNVSTVNIKESVKIAKEVFDFIKHLEMNYQDLNKNTESVLQAIANNICKEADEKGKDPAVTKTIMKYNSNATMSEISNAILQFLLSMLSIDINYTPNYANCRTLILNKYNRDHTKFVEIVMESHALSKTLLHATKAAKLLALQAPDVILMSEFKMMGEGIVFMLSIPYLKTVDTEIFTQYFGVHPDGTLADTHFNKNEITKESILEYKQMCESAQADCEYYTVAYSPDYMMFDYEFTIFCNITNDHYRDNTGTVVGFNSYLQAETQRQTLLKELSKLL